MKCRYSIENNQGGYYVKVYSPDLMMYSTEWCYTLWGAKRAVKRLAKSYKKYQEPFEGEIEI